MKVSLLILTSIFGQIALASPHRHLHNHQHAARHVKREDDSPITTWVTEWVSVIKTVEVTTTLWVTPSVPEPSQVMDSKQDIPTEAQVIDTQQDIPAEAPALPSPSPAEFFEPQPSQNVQNMPVPSLEPSPVEILSPTPTSTELKVELPQQQHEAVPEIVDPTPATNEPATALSNNNITAPVDHATSSGSCTAGSPCNGDITYYDPGTGAGACGWQNTKDEPVVALPHAFMGEKSNGNPYCGKTITIVRNGKTSTARVVDKCMGCTGFSIDLSDSVFTQLAALSVGRTSAKWWIN
ncbi:hypothetical protein EPUL_000535 [Erysiphe pulchra]|uniref:RlpA-like protein double-psi beta-barrel domain-containing protein n=1 Tax=Erysiphe pulchra TaxID=225359 RepID=A0A2S4Q135_9PEZI|nr:hypothetical protein EPUL_000535 [Erysiphe pulchra]